MALLRFLNPVEPKPKNGKCILKGLTPDLLDIELDDEKIDIGRSRLTGIRDPCCSKKQTVKLDLPKGVLTLKVNGSNPSGLNGFALETGKGYEAFHGDILEVLYSKIKYKVLFDPPPVAKTAMKPVDSKQALEPPGKKQKVDENEIAAGSQISGSWESIDAGKLLIYRPSNLVSSEKVASYDLDGTLIKTKSGNVFAKNRDDWQLIYSEVPGKLKALHKDGYKIVIFTNQAAISKGTLKPEDIQFKIECIMKKIGVPMYCLISSADSIYRKPRIGMWKYLEEKENDGIKINMTESFYVGDAAGRPEQTTAVKRKKDHSSADRLMALNLNLIFYTPEQHFLGHKPLSWMKPAFDPRNSYSYNLYEPKNTKVPSAKPEVIVMVAIPGSGKSFFARKTLEPLGYKVINRDELGTAQKCITLCEKTLKDGVSCVIDNTNVDAASRKQYIEIAQKHSIPVRCFVMNVTIDHVRHNLAFRNLTDSKHVKVNSMILNSLKKKFEEPNMKEGFTEIVKVNFIPVFQNTEDEKLYKMFLVE